MNTLHLVNIGEYGVINFNDMILVTKNVINRCCNYPLLEQKCSEYNKKGT